MRPAEAREDVRRRLEVLGEQHLAKLRAARDARSAGEKIRDALEVTGACAAALALGAGAILVVCAWPIAIVACVWLLVRALG